MRFEAQLAKSLWDGQGLETLCNYEWADVPTSIILSTWRLLAMGSKTGVDFT
jgi:hypothetical protein